MTPDLERARIRIARELMPPGPSENPTFYRQAYDAKAAIAAAAATGRTPAVRCAAALYGGLLKRWRQYLVQMLTEAAWGDRDCSRESMRAWQKRVFGQSIASKDLARYATPSRNGGGRADLKTPPEAVENEAIMIFREFEGRLQDAAEHVRLKHTLHTIIRAHTTKK